MKHTEFLAKIAEAVQADKSGKDMNISEIGRVLKGIQKVNRQERSFDFAHYLIHYVLRK